MLNRLIGIEQKKLDELSAQRVQFHEQLQRKKYHISQLATYQQALTANSGDSQVLHLQNMQSMRNQVDGLIDNQQFEIDLHEADLLRQNTLISQKIGQVKGFETVLRRRESKAQLAQDIAEQFQNDELAIQVFLRNRD
ncbi:flagellar FliJ family protein [Moritella sp.]|uniref:flagellar FliJ family protein n=1 Tax=Moritella sp. TaxID=78556 RepID=UPI001E072817|nr:flagellar FliJ family protein [Moritella sp.]MCJ8349452.1 flagellar FliJ family protein [Moritella sp.]NQZ39233.1 flagellar FliJ family protein [Moritella sp.]